ncbi:MAG: DUF4292 domain-containing protein [Syntrophales bacterium]
MFFSVLLLLGGCSVGKTIKPTEEKLGYASAQAALSAINPPTDDTLLYRSTARVSVVSPQSKINFRIAIFLQLSDKLRLESIPVLGPPDFFLTVRGGWIRAYLPTGGEFLVGKATPDNLSRFLPLSWPVEKWMAVLLGNGPNVTLQPTQLVGKMEDSLYRVDMTTADALTESLWINPLQDRLEKIERSSSAGRKETVTFNAFRKMNGRTFPSRISIDTGEGRTITIVHETMETTMEKPDNFFTLRPPPEATIRALPD